MEWRPAFPVERVDIGPCWDNEMRKGEGGKGEGKDVRWDKFVKCTCACVLALGEDSPPLISTAAMSGRFLSVMPWIGTLGE